MAKIKVITDFDFTRKKYGGSIIQQGRIAPTFRNNPATRQFRTPTQLSFNSFMMLCVRHWRNMSPTQKTVWNDWSELFPQPTIRNAANFVNGYELFVKRNYYKALFEGSEFTFMLNPSESIYPTDELTPVLTIGEDQINLSCTFSRGVGDLHCFIFVSSSVSPGLSFGNTRWRFMAAIPTIDQEIDITNNFVGQFGRLPAVDDHLFVSVLFTGSDNGQFTFHDLIPVVVEPPAPPFTVVKFGRLYNFYCFLDGRGLLATDWDFITLAEIDAMRAVLDPSGTISSNVAGRHMKVNSLDFWLSGNDADNSSGLNCKGSGNRSNLGVFGQFKATSDFWSKTYAATSSRVCSTSISAIMTRGLSPFKAGRNIRAVYRGSGSPSQYVGNDGKTYPVVTIGSLTISAEPLIETKFRDGSSIPVVTDSTAWSNLLSAGSCSINNDPLND